jgi:Na+/phosphate symporter
MTSTDFRTTFIRISKMNLQINQAIQTSINKISASVSIEDNCNLLIELFQVYQQELRYVNQFSQEYLQEMKKLYKKFMMSFQSNMILIHSMMMDHAPYYGAFPSFQKMSAEISRYTVELLGKIGPVE